ncbi:MAG: hypothetical protein CUN55_02305 [Phototrophicales bacterium]|nr:MAG: hypothetical protein CUN55_02305 [Phototrophicales bacterium]
MDSAMIGKIQKAKEYAEQPERMQFVSFKVDFEGENSTHQVIFNEGNWECGCSFFKSRGFCSHTMALQRVLGKMLTAHNKEEMPEQKVVEASAE